MSSGYNSQDIYIVSKTSKVKVDKGSGDVIIEDLSFAERAEGATAKLTDLLSIAAEKMESVAQGRSWEVEITGTFTLGGEFGVGKIAFDASFCLSSTIEIERSQTTHISDNT